MKKFLFLVAALAAIGGAVWAQAPGVNSPFQPVWSIPLDSIKRTYSLSVWQLSPAASATDIWQICGGPSVITRLTKLSVGGRATAAAPADLNLIKRSGQTFGGTVAIAPPFSGVSAVGVPYDASTGASTAFVTAWTANPTVGTVVGTIAIKQYYLGNLTTGTTNPPAEFAFGNGPGSAVVLRSSTQCLSLNLSAQTFSGGIMDISAEWTEE